MAVREAREKVRPRQRARVGIGHIDLELREHHEQRRGRHRPAVVGEHIFIGGQVHLVRVHRAVRRHHVGDGEPGQQRAAQHLEHAQHHPARPARQHPEPPAPARLRRAGGHEAQVVGLLAHLRDERDAHRERRTKQGQLEARTLPRFTTIVHDARERTRIAQQHIGKRHHQHDQPQRLRPHLQAADGRDAVRDQRNHHDGANQVAPGGRDVQRQLQRIGHHGGFERKEDESEAGVDQRGERGADVAKARAAREQVHVHAVARGVHADGQPRQKDDEPRGHDGPEGVDEAVLHQQRGAHGLQDEERGRAKRRVRHPPFGPFAKALRCVAQRVVLHRLGGHPAVVVAPDLHHLLGCMAGVVRWSQGRGHGACQMQLPCHGSAASAPCGVWPGTGIADMLATACARSDCPMDLFLIFGHCGDRTSQRPPHGVKRHGTDPSRSTAPAVGRAIDPGLE